MTLTKRALDYLDKCEWETSVKDEKESDEVNVTLRAYRTLHKNLASIVASLWKP